MRAMVVTQFGGPDVLAMQDIPDPTPCEDDLLIEVHGSALNPIDYKIRGGAFGAGRSFPFVLGFDVSGTVRSLGSRTSSTTDFHIGDEVYASPSLIRDGANAQYVCVDGRTAARKPRSIDHTQAAALPLVTLTAWEALYERANLKSGQTVLIQAGGGGVGHIAIQLARLRDCRVLTTSSREQSIELCRSLGADVVINYAEEDFVQRVKDETDGQGCSVVFDCVGGDVFDRSAQCLAVNGQMLTIVGASSGGEAMKELFIRNATLHFEMMGTPTMYGVHPEKQGEILRAAAEFVDRGKLRAHVSRTIELEQLSEGHRWQEASHVTGKIAVSM